jgi:hypothetical protein
MSGAQTNLKEYPKAAQLKNVTVARSTPASRNQADRVEKINKIGIPAENPRSSMEITRGWSQAWKISFQSLLLALVPIILVFSHLHKNSDVKNTTTQ